MIVPPNCEECNGHLIVADPPQHTTANPQADTRFFLWSPGVGFWGFYIRDINQARANCRAVKASDK